VRRARATLRRRSRESVTAPTGWAGRPTVNFGAMILSAAPAASGLSPAAFALALPSVVALAAYVGATAASQRFASALRRALVVGWAAQGLSILVDVAGLGSASPGIRFGFAPALSITLWLVVAVYLVESRLVPLPGARRALAGFGAVVVVLAWIYPGRVQPGAVSVWAPAHWLLGIASYALFGVAVLHAVLLSRAERRLRVSLRDPLADADRHEGMPLLRLERLTYTFVGAGFAVLTAAIALGALHTPVWRWDHKTVFSLLAWVVFAALLAGRRAFGWRGPRATGWIYAGAALLLLAYAGSRFVLEVVLHR
jgi:ABC-type uncharacterized transport system permease subunit